MIHLYAVCRQAPRELPAAGVEGARPVTVEVGALVAVISEHEHAPRASEANALAHAEVVAAVTDTTSALPVRFGSQHADRGALDANLGHRQAALTDALDDVGDAREIVIRAAVSGDDRPSPPVTSAAEASAPGRAYMEDRLTAESERRAREEAAGAALAGATSTLAARALRVRDVRGRRGPERCFLVPRQDAEEFAADARDITVDLPGAVTGGPWPPYSFATDEDDP